MRIVPDVIHPEMGSAVPGAAEEMLRKFALRGWRQFCRESSVWRQVVYAGPLPEAGLSLVDTADPLAIYAVAGETPFDAAAFLAGARGSGRRVGLPAVGDPVHVGFALAASRDLVDVRIPAYSAASLRSRFDRTWDVELRGVECQTWASHGRFDERISGAALELVASRPPAGSPPSSVVAIPPNARIAWIYQAKDDENNEFDVLFDTETSILRAPMERERGTITAVLEPTDDAAEMPALFDKWREAIVELAVALLLQSPGEEWTSFSGAAWHRRRYGQHLSDARITLARGANAEMASAAHPFI